MKIGIISDTHDEYSNVLAAIDVFNEQGVEYVFHAGDMISPFMAEAFADVKGAKFITVFGNCDCERKLIKEAVESFGGEVYGNRYSGKVGGKRIFMTHRGDVVKSMAESGSCDVVIYGHTHKQDIRKLGDVLIVNPGRSNVAVVDFEDMSVEEISLGV